MDVSMKTNLSNSYDLIFNNNLIYDLRYMYIYKPGQDFAIKNKLQKSLRATMRSILQATRSALGQ